MMIAGEATTCTDTYDDSRGVIYDCNIFIVQATCWLWWLQAVGDFLEGHNSGWRLGNWKFILEFIYCRKKSVCSDILYFRY